MSAKSPLAFQIGARIRDIRYIRGLSQSAVAQRAATTPSDVSRAEIGIRMPTLLTLRRFAEALRVGVGDLLDIEENALPAELAVLLADLRAASPEVRKLALESIYPHLEITPGQDAKAPATTAPAMGQTSGGDHVL
ncbi:helix-turn-helix domain-containing protein [Myxococcota bacterium]|nr:helix-turn-helix domain-containing protein [Myxococcota bacterium]